MNEIDKIFQLLTAQGKRLPALLQWLKEEVWSKMNYKNLAPEEYLKQGENTVHEVEELILAAAQGLYDELISASLQTENIIDALAETKRTAIIIFDGASIRELPLFEELANKTGFEIIESTYEYAALPSESDFFIEQRILGKRIAPSQLTSRKELSEKNIYGLYYDSFLTKYELPLDGRAILLWSHFPDGSYKDLSAKTSFHFGEMKDIFDTVWKNIVLAIPKDYQITITSDHGYIFFGSQLESTLAHDGAKLLNQDRYKFFTDDEALPDEHPDLQIAPDKRLAMLRGRIKLRPQGPSGNKAYRHGGMSLMEMLTPKLVIKQMNK